MIIVITALIFFLGFSQHQAQGTSPAFMIPPVTLMATIHYLKNGCVNWKFALILALAFFIGGYFGSKNSISLPDRALRMAFGGLLLVVAEKLIFWK
ncbi:MAG TPA: sulfite exporter TauE/SafE family protein [Prolixibacteraceae bacterium]